MWSVKDLWRIFNFLKDGTIDPRMDSNTRALSESERQTATNLFTNNIDQVCFNSNDYKRLRKFFVDWYATHRTLTSTQKNVTDLFSLPEDHINELFRSFGFDLGLKLVPLATKVNLFLDLVNLYKKKGTPEALIDILDYYGFTDADLIEYWLLKNNSGNLVFRGENVRETTTGSTTLLEQDVPYNTMTQDDPHWMLSESQANSLIDANKIATPTKTPYFSLSSIFSLERLNAALTILVRKVQDQYELWSGGGNLPQDITVKNVGYVVSILEVYLGSIYALEKNFGQMSNSNDANHMCFDGDELPDPLYKVIDGLTDSGGDPISYNFLTSLPNTRDERAEKLEKFDDYFSKPMSQNFLDSYGKAGQVLQQINPELKSEIDSWFDQADAESIIMYLIGTLDIWMRTNIDSRIPSLVITTLGFGFKDEVKNIIEFFKPYRARLAFIDTAFSIDNPLTESIRLDDLYTDIIKQTFIDMPKAGGGDADYDTGSHYDTGMIDDDFYEYLTDEFIDNQLTTDLLHQIIQDTYEDTISVTDSLYETIIQSPTDNINLSDYFNIIEAFIFTEVLNCNLPNESWSNYDEGTVFDCVFGSDIVMYQISETITDTEIVNDLPTHIVIDTITDILNYHPPTDETTHDFDEGWSFDTFPTQYQSFPNYDEGSVFDCMFGSDIVIQKVSQQISDAAIVLDNLKFMSIEEDLHETISVTDQFYVGDVYIDVMTGLLPGNPATLIHSEHQENGGNVTFVVQSGGFYDFDEPGAEFDTASGKDLCEIIVTELP